MTGSSGPGPRSQEASFQCLLCLEGPAPLGLGAFKTLIAPVRGTLLQQGHKEPGGRGTLTKGKAV